MKVLYVIGALWNSGGMERVLSVKANYLVSVLKYKVTILTMHQRNRPVFFPISPKIKLLDLGYNDPPSAFFSIQRITDLLEHRRKKQNFRKIIRQEAPDIVVSLCGPFLFQRDEKEFSRILESHFSPDAREVMYKAKGLGILSKPLSAIFSFFTYQKIRKCVDIHVSLTDADASFWKTIAREALAISNPLTIEIPNRTATISSHRAISVARLDPLKGVDILIDAWQEVHKSFPDWKLDIFGSGELSQTLTEQIKNRNLNGCVFLRGTTNDIVKEYTNSSLFISSSRSEGFPLVIIESMACGLPVVATNTCGAESILGKNYSGLAKAGDIESLKRKICEALSNKTRMKEMSLFCRKKAEAYTLPSIMRQWDCLFRKAVADLSQKKTNA